MVAKQPSIPTKFSALQYRGVEFDTKPCSESDGLSGDTVGLSDAQFEFIQRRAKTEPSAPDDPTPGQDEASVYPTVE
jgi:hypothetical protein